MKSIFSSMNSSNMKCENCGKDHDGSYGSGRFCSVKCSRGFSTKAKRKEINKKVSEKMYKGNYKICDCGKKLSYNNKSGSCIKCIKKYRQPAKTLSDKMTLWRNRTKEKAVEYKGGKCIICGYSKYNGNLDFHHINPAEKSFSISEARRSSIKWEIIEEELDKCVLVCCRCHGEIHGGLINI